MEDNESSTNRDSSHVVDDDDSDDEDLSYVSSEDEDEFWEEVDTNDDTNDETTEVCSDVYDHEFVEDDEIEYEHVIDDDTDNDFIDDNGHNLELLGSLEQMRNTRDDKSHEHIGNNDDSSIIDKSCSSSYTDASYDDAVSSSLPPSDFDMGSYSRHSLDDDAIDPKDIELECRKLIAVVHPGLEDSETMLHGCDLQNLYNNLKHQYYHILRHNTPNDSTNVEMVDYDYDDDDEHEFTEESYELSETDDVANRPVQRESPIYTDDTSLPKDAASASANPKTVRVEKWLERNKDDPEDYEYACRLLCHAMYGEDDPEHDIESMLSRSSHVDLYRYLKQQYWYLAHTNQLSTTRNGDNDNDIASKQDGMPADDGFVKKSKRQRIDSNEGNSTNNKDLDTSSDNTGKQPTKTRVHALASLYAARSKEHAEQDQRLVSEGGGGGRAKEKEKGLVHNKSSCTVENNDESDNKNAETNVESGPSLQPSSPEQQQENLSLEDENSHLSSHEEVLLRQDGTSAQSQLMDTNDGSVSHISSDNHRSSQIRGEEESDVEDHHASRDENDTSFKTEKYVSYSKEHDVLFDRQENGEDADKDQLFHLESAARKINGDKPPKNELEDLEEFESREQQQGDGMMHIEEDDNRSGLTLVVLLSEFSGTLQQRSEQERAMSILRGSSIRNIEEVDGSLKSNRDRRNKLFEVSGERGKYPQFFLQKEEKMVIYLGDFEWLTYMNDIGSLTNDTIYRVLDSAHPLTERNEIQDESERIIENQCSEKNPLFLERGVDSRIPQQQIRSISDDSSSEEESESSNEKDSSYSSEESETTSSCSDDSESTMDFDNSMNGGNPPSIEKDADITTTMAPIVDSESEKLTHTDIPSSVDDDNQIPATHSSLNDNEKECCEEEILIPDEDSAGSHSIKDEKNKNREYVLLSDDSSSCSSLSEAENDQPMTPSNQLPDETPNEHSDIEVPKIDPKELEWRKKKIQNALMEIIKETEKNELEDIIPQEITEALNAASLKTAFTRKYYDSKKEKYVYYPSVSQAVFNFSLIEEAEHHFNGEIPFNISTALCTIVAARLKGNIDEVDDSDSIVKGSSVNVILPDEQNKTAPQTTEESIALNDARNVREEQNTNGISATKSQAENNERMKKIKHDLFSVIKHAEATDLRESITDEVFEALMRAANRNVFVKKYFDVTTDQFIYYPSITKRILDNSLFEEARQFCSAGDLPLKYVSALHAAAEVKSSKSTEVNELDDYVINMSVDVAICDDQEVGEFFRNTKCSLTTASTASSLNEMSSCVPEVTATNANDEYSCSDTSSPPNNDSSKEDSKSDVTKAEEGTGGSSDIKISEGRSLDNGNGEEASLEEMPQIVEVESRVESKEMVENAKALEEKKNRAMMKAIDEAKRLDESHRMAEAQLNEESLLRKAKYEDDKRAIDKALVNLESNFSSQVKRLEKEVNECNQKHQTERKRIEKKRNKIEQQFLADERILMDQTKILLEKLTRVVSILESERQNADADQEIDSKEVATETSRGWFGGITKKSEEQLRRQEKSKKWKLREEELEKEIDDIKAELNVVQKGAKVKKRRVNKLKEKLENESCKNEEIADENEERLQQETDEIQKTFNREKEGLKIAMCHLENTRAEDEEWLASSRKKLYDNYNKCQETLKRVSSELKEIEHEKEEMYQRNAIALKEKRVHEESELLSELEPSEHKEVENDIDASLQGTGETPDKISGSYRDLSEQEQSDSEKDVMETKLPVGLQQIEEKPVKMQLMHGEKETDKAKNVMAGISNPDVRFDQVTCVTNTSNVSENNVDVPETGDNIEGKEKSAENAIIDDTTNPATPNHLSHLYQPNEFQEDEKSLKPNDLFDPPNSNEFATKKLLTAALLAKDAMNASENNADAPYPGDNIEGKEKSAPVDTENAIIDDTTKPATPNHLSHLCQPNEFQEDEKSLKPNDLFDPPNSNEFATKKLLTAALLAKDAMNASENNADAPYPGDNIEGKEKSVSVDTENAIIDDTTNPATPNHLSHLCQPNEFQEYEKSLKPNDLFDPPNSNEFATKKLLTAALLAKQQEQEALQGKTKTPTVEDQTQLLAPSIQTKTVSTNITPPQSPERVAVQTTQGSVIADPALFRTNFLTDVSPSRSLAEKRRKVKETRQRAMAIRNASSRIVIDDNRLCKTNAKDSAVVNGIEAKNYSTKRSQTSELSMKQRQKVEEPFSISRSISRSPKKLPASSPRSVHSMEPMIRETDRLSGFIRRYENKLETVCRSLLTVASATGEDSETLAARKLDLPEMFEFITQQDWYKEHSQDLNSLDLPHLKFSKRRSRDGRHSNDNNEYKITATGKEFMQLDGPVQSDVSRFLAHIEYTKVGVTRHSMLEHWKEISRASEDVQNQRVCDKLDKLISFCLDSCMIQKSKEAAATV